MSEAVNNAQVVVALVGFLGAASLMGEEVEQIIAGGVVAAVALIAMVALVWLSARRRGGE